MASSLKLAFIASVIVLLATVRASASDFLWQDQVDGTADLALGTASDNANAVAADGDRVFIAGTIHNRLVGLVRVLHFAVRAYDAWTGALLWEDLTHLDGFGFATAIAVHDGRVFVAGHLSENQVTLVRAYDAITGSLLWQHTIAAGSVLSPVIKIAALGDQVFVVGAVNFLYAIRAYGAATGVLQWEDRIVFPNISSATAVAASEGQVFVVGGSLFTSSTRAYDARTGALLWDRFDNDYQPVAIVVNGRHVSTAGRVGDLRANRGDFIVRTHDGYTGDLLWEDRVYGFDGNSGIAADVVTDGRSIYVAGRIRLNDTLAGTGEFAVRAYDAESGRVLWMDIVGTAGTSESATSAVLRQGQLIVAGALDVLGTGLDLVVRTYVADTGELLWDDFVNGTANSRDVAADVAVLPHAIYVVGTLTDVDTRNDFYVRGYYR